MTNMTWAQHAACQDADPHQFFPNETGGHNRIRKRPLARATARQWCAHCPVIDECRDYAQTHQPEPHGIWGGEIHWWDPRQGMRSLNLLEQAT